MTTATAPTIGRDQLAIARRQLHDAIDEHKLPLRAHYVTDLVVDLLTGRLRTDVTERAVRRAVESLGWGSVRQAGSECGEPCRVDLELGRVSRTLGYLLDDDADGALIWFSALGAPAGRSTFVLGGEVRDYHAWFTHQRVVPVTWEL